MKRPWHRWPRRTEPQTEPQPEPQRLVPGVQLPAPDDELTVDLAAVREELDQAAAAQRAMVTYDEQAAARRWVGVSTVDVTEWQRRRIREQYGMSADLPDAYGSNRAGWLHNGPQTANTGRRW